jgi:nucleoid-associated protein YgaU
VVPVEQVYQTYVVAAGDSLSRIAKRFYGSADEWRRIFEANSDVLKDPDKIFPGQKLKIPEKG